MSEEKFILSPEEVKKRKSQSKSQIVTDNNELNQAIPENYKKEEIKDSSEKKDKFRNLGNKVEIELESGGRFDSPPVVYFEDYSSNDITSIVTSREEDILETLIHVMDKCYIKEDSNSDNFSTGDMTPEEFLECQLGIKLQFDSPFMNYRWMCENSECQEDTDIDKKKFSETEIDLSEIQTISIENLEEEIRQKYLDVFNEDNNIFKQYLYNKYGDDISNISLEDEVKSISIKEPINITSNGNRFKFRFMRMKDLINSTKKASSEFDPIIRQIKSRKYGGLNFEEVKVRKEKEIEDIKRKKAEAAINYSQAFCLIGFNDKTNLSDDDKIKYFKLLKRRENLQLMKQFDMCKYGIRHDFETTCNHCGITSRRSLQRGLSPFDLLPFTDDSQSNSIEKLRRNNFANIYFG